jgi:YesN/AraC family two-component response regulator
LDQNKYEEAGAQMEQFFEKLRHATYLHPDYVKALCNEILTAYLHQARRIPLDEQEEANLGKIQTTMGGNVPNLEKLEENVHAATEYISSLLKEKEKVNQYSEPVLEIMKYVREHYPERISLEQLANLVHMSRTYISILFKKEVGENFSDYLQRVRLMQSCILLDGTRLSIQEIGERTGFFDTSHFSRVFKEWYGMSPLEYRKRNSDS